MKWIFLSILAVVFLQNSEAAVCRLKFKLVLSDGRVVGRQFAGGNGNSTDDARNDLYKNLDFITSGPGIAGIIFDKNKIKCSDESKACPEYNPEAGVYCLSN